MQYKYVIAITEWWGCTECLCWPVLSYKYMNTALIARSPCTISVLSWLITRSSCYLATQLESHSQYIVISLSEVTWLIFLKLRGSLRLVYQDSGKERYQCFILKVNVNFGRIWYGRIYIFKYSDLRILKWSDESWSNH